MYDPTKLVGKEEDICHVTNRMGTQLRSIDLTRDYKGNKMPISAATISYVKPGPQFILESI